jgi:biotin carboxylase
MSDIPAPWVLKPRSQAGAIGIKKIQSEQELWDAADKLGDQQSFYLLERYVPGEVFHVDSIWDNSELLFSIASRYGAPPMDVSHGGGVFSSRTLPRDSAESKALIDLNKQVLKSFGLVRGVSHSEFIRSADKGRFYFLETAARVGGANLADMIQAASGINMWREWAKVEISGGKKPYSPPEPKTDNAGILVSLSRYQHPDTSEFKDPEIVWRMFKDYHIGMVVKSPDPARVEELLTKYAQKIAREFMAVAPAAERATH